MNEEPEGGPALAPAAPARAPSWLDARGRLELVVVAAALVAFGPSLAAGYVFDDLPLIVDNPFAHEWRYLERCFRTDLWDTPERPSPAASLLFYRPVVTASYLASWALGGGAPWLFHLGNVLAHAVAAWLAVRVALRWTGAPWPALLAALLFAVHPTRTENVVWISGRTDVLMAVFLLAALELSVAAARSGRALLWGAVGLLWVLAVLSKEYAVCLPILLGVEAALASARGDPVTRRRLLASAAAVAAGVAAYFVARGVWMPLRPPEARGAAPPLPLHLAWILLTAGFYAERLALPWPQTFHYRPVLLEGEGPALPAASVALGAIVLVALVAASARAWRRERALAWLFGAAVVCVLPIVHVVYAGFDSPTADRFLYFPALALGCALARGLAGPIERWRVRSRLAGVLVGSVTLAYAGIVWARTLDYRDDEAMWSRELEINPTSPRALSGLAQVRDADGALHEAFELMARASSPGARRQYLLAKPVRVYLAQLELHGRRLADGDAQALTALLEEQLALVDGRPPGPLRRSADFELERPSDPHFEVFVENARYHLAPAAAFVASRLGRDDDVRRMAALVPAEALIDPRVRFNLALALARGSAWEAALEQLARAEAAQSLGGAARALGDRLRQARAEAAAAATEGEPGRSVRLARVDLELGGYLRAARRLRPLLPELDAEGRRVLGEALALARRPEAGSLLTPAELRQIEGARSELVVRALPPDPAAPW